MSKVAYKNKVVDIADIFSAFPLRTSVSTLGEGDTHMIQLKDIDYGIGVLWNQVVKIELSLKSNSIRWLQDGDILFAARNSNNFATTLKHTPNKTLCVPHFFVIRIKDKSAINSDFLSWQINQAPAQTYFKKSAGVSLVPNINRSLLENLEVVIPSIEQQENIVNMHHDMIGEKQVLQSLIHNREQQMKAIASNIFRA